MKNFFNAVAQNPAVKLANEWRDTLFYSSGLLLYSSASINAGHLVDPNLFTFLWPVSRECARNIFWNFNPEHHVFSGFEQKKIDSELMTSSSCFALCAASLSMGFVSILSNNIVGYIGAGGTLPVCALSLHSSGGIKNVFKAYTETMWDYPRKKGGGGTTQTEKLKSWVQTTVGSLVFGPVANPTRSALRMAGLSL